MIVGADAMPGEGNIQWQRHWIGFSRGIGNGIWECSLNGKCTGPVSKNKVSFQDVKMHALSLCAKNFRYAKLNYVHTINVWLRRSGGIVKNSMVIEFRWSKFQ